MKEPNEVNDTWTKSMISLPDWPVKQVLKLTSLSDTFLVGGTVRDLMLNRPLHDWDFVTFANGIKLAKQAANSFNGAFYALDRNRGTGRAVVRPPHSQLTITLDFASVRGTDLVEDLKARDFTINSMAMTLSGELIDPLECADDLAREILRITTPSSFDHDPIRLLRAIRQSHLLDYPIEAATYKALCQTAHRITEVSPERVIAELCAMLNQATTAPSAASLRNSGLLQHIIPELHHISGFDSLSTADDTHTWQVTLQTLDYADQLLTFIESQPADVAANPPTISGWGNISGEITPHKGALQQYYTEMVNSDISHSTVLKLAALVQFVPEIKLQDRLTALRLPNKTISTLSKVLQSALELRSMTTEINRTQIYRIYRKADLAVPGAALFTLISATADPTRLPDDQTLERLSHNTGRLLKTYFEDIESLSPEPFLRGGTLIEMGIAAGPDVGLILERLIEAQITGKVTSQASAVEFVNRIISG